MLDEQKRWPVRHEADGVDADLQAVAVLAAQLCQMPMAAVSLMGERDQRFVGSVGFDGVSVDRGSSFCAEVVQRSAALLVPDTHADVRFADHPWVTGKPHIRAYAGVPILSADHVPVGTVCVLDTQPRTPSASQMAALESLAMVTRRLLQAQRAGIELVAVQQAQQAANSQFQTAFDHLTTGMTLVDDGGRFLRVNRAFADLLGYSVDDLVGRSFREFTDDTDIDTDVQAITELVAGLRRAALREKRYRHRDGSLISALVSSSLIQPDRDGPWQLLNSVESLTERRAAEARLLELHSAVDGIITIDGHGRVLAWNLGAQNLLGHSAADMLGQPLDRIIPAHARAAHNAGVARAASGQPTRLVGTTVEVPVVHAAGHELLTELSLSSWTQDGRPRFTAVLRDITAQRRTEVATALTRHAAVTANSTDVFADAAAAIVREVCTRLGWRAGHAWTADDSRAIWHVGEHLGAGGEPHPATSAPQPGPAGRCPLHVLAAQHAAPTREDLPFSSTVQVATAPRELQPMGPAVHACGIGAAVAVPVLAGGEVTGTLAFYLPHSSPAPDTEIITALEQVGMAVGRVVERQRTRAHLAWQASHDPLTDLASRRLLLERIGAAQRETATTAGTRYAVLLLNLDRFRTINDSLGYAVGDELLRQVADRLRTAVRTGDLVARLSADEFVILTRHLTDDPGGPADMFAAVAQRLLTRLAEPVQIAGHRLQLRASIGLCPISTAHAGGSHNPARLLRDADAALRHAKRRGKNQIQVFDAGMADRAEQRLGDETALAEAILGDQLRLHYQPIVDLPTGCVVGAEALVRWQRPGHGMVPPDRFIALAEDTGLIIGLGRWVLRRACHDAAAWPELVPAMANASISVNVSARQLVHPEFLADLDAALADSGLDARRLTLEITETALIGETEAVLEVLHAVRRRDVQLALDDFGTGYSSLSYVQQLPATILKIDKSFVDPINGPGDGIALSEVVIKLAAATGLRTVAEGVETREQAEALRLLGCQRGQGYTWSRPVPQDQLGQAVAGMTPAPVEGARI
ncbi:hypothetical protein ACWT_3391 [Actinoplanes sp. SE50]|uniref:EAL domain-containing protein n=1 Tax=unclassified Actinoplanes TaxID=2626549 RepID=UPI00023ED238|nr:MULTISPECIES: EAL domain-containing protein [unclassified Actinoplanes]AEV84414.1 hypothetical protein ACPL_3519 [Actinoplanes sp. SE50/110]ATO82806.1 hypothetical protein ACWT_3391 [Actinoplanes sp. SE50]SLM00214.1 hypothetical protein ACSP50_3446 [Actinoplanes sp. SE50/110]